MDNQERNVTQTNLSPDQEDKIMWAVFSTPQGKQALDILKENFYDRPSYVKTEGPQPHQTIYREGQRDVVGWIMLAIDRINFPDNTKPDVKGTARVKRRDK